jgi:signal transduction histidine kinase
MKKVMVIILLLMMHAALLPANTEIDSLENAIRTWKGIPRNEARLQLAYILRRSDFERSASEAKAALASARELGDRDQEATAYYYLGLAYHYDYQTDSALYFLQCSEKIYRSEENHEDLAKVLSMIGTNYLSTTGDQEQAIRYYNEALHEARKSNDHETMAIVYSQLSNIFRMNGSYQQAIEFIYKAREHYEIIDFAEGIAWINYSIGRIYNTMGLYEEAVDLFHQGLEIYQQLPQTVSARTGVAICMDELGLAYLELGNIEKAREYNRAAIEKYRTIRKSGFGISNSLKYLARIEYTEGNYEEALRQLDKSRRIKVRMNDKLGMPGIYLLYGKTMLKMEQFQSAIDSLHVGLKYAVNNNQKTLIMHINAELSGLHSKMGDYEKAFDYQSRQLGIMDSIYESRATRGMTQLESMYALQAKEEVIHKLEQENTIQNLKLSRERIVRTLLMLILLLVVLFALIILRLYINNRNINAELKEQRKKLQELNATKDKFFSIIAHDLKSPFNSIIGFSSLLERYSQSGDVDKMKEFSGHIKDVSTQTFKLLENLLEWSRSQTGRIKFLPKELDIAVSIQNAMDLVSPVASRKNIRFESDVASVKVQADENMLHTVFQNLLSNAVKYSHKGSTVRIEMSEFPEEIEIGIHDHGIGMDTDTAERIFSIGENVSRPGTEKEQGTGLGLIICKEFIEKHGGSIRVQSESGRGSIFTITLPKVKSDPESREA